MILPSVKETTLEKLRWGIKRKAPFNIASIEFEDIDDCAEYIAVCIRGFTWAETIEERHVDYPADWWQSFKLAKFPAWALKRWPVVWTGKTIRIAAGYPEFKPSVPDHNYVLRFFPWEA